MADLSKHMSEDGVSDALTLKRRTHSHIDDMEVPAAVADDSTHPDGLVAWLMTGTQRLSNYLAGP